MTNIRLANVPNASLLLFTGGAALWSSHAKPEKKNCKQQQRQQQQQQQQKKKKTKKKKKKKKKKKRTRRRRRLLFPVYLVERETEVVTAGDGQTEISRRDVNCRTHSLVRKDMDEFRSVDKFLDSLLSVYVTFAS